MPITLRTLKKKSKQALAILRAHYPDQLEGQTVFMAERFDNYHGLVIRCTHGCGDPCRVPTRPRCECTSHPLKGTPMIGGVSGYYEPEWDERTALEVLRNAVSWGARPESMTDRAWRRTLAVAGVQPIDPVQFEADMRALNAESISDWSARPADALDIAGAAHG